MNLDILREIRQTEKGTYCIIFIHTNAINANLDYSGRKYMNKSEQLCDWKQTWGL